MTLSSDSPLARLLLAVLAAAALSSCTVYEGGYYAEGPAYAGGGYYNGGYYDEWSDDYYDYHPPIYRSYVTYAPGWPYYYGGRYYAYRWWDDDRYRDYCHDHGRNHDRYRKRRSSEEMKLVRYHGEDRGRLPSGYHSDQWYKDRGYSLKGNTYRERDGDLRGRQPSSSSRKRDDDRPSSEHPRALPQPDKYRYTGNRSRDDDRRRSEAERRSSSSSRGADDRSRSSSDHRSSSSSSRSRGDDRPSSQHPRALQQPDKYRYTGSGGDRSERSGHSGHSGDKGGDKGGKGNKH
jgi:hypothetical protein